MAMSLNEEQIERRVEKMTDRLDRKYMNGEIDTEEYQKQLSDIDYWACQQYDDLAKY